MMVAPSDPRWSPARTSSSAAGTGRNGTHRGAGGFDERIPCAGTGCEEQRHATSPMVLRPAPAGTGGGLSLSDGGTLSIPVRGESPDLKTTRLTVGTAIGRRLGAAKGTDPHRNRGTVRISVRPCCSLPQVPSAERADIPSLLDLFFTSGTSIDTIA